MRKIIQLLAKKYAKFSNKMRKKWKAIGKRAQKFLYYSYYEKLPIRQKAVFYQAYRPKIMSGNPFAMFQAMIDDPQYADYVHYWAYGADEVLETETCKRYRNHPRVKFVKGRSLAYLKCLASCKYLVNNAALPDYWIKRKDQVYINTWHGTPLKCLGRDALDRSDASVSNAQRNFFLCDYMVMPNKYTTDRMLYSYFLENQIPGTIIEAGYPRIDLVRNTDKDMIRKVLEDRVGYSLKDKKIILYAPTFRTEGGSSVDESEQVVAYIRQMIHNTPEGYVIFFKIHNMVFKYFKDNAEFEELFIFDEIETNELLSVVDILITDYSSVFFDYLCTGKPILFFVYDRREYETGHGLYFSMEELPGALCETVDELMEQVRSIDAGTYHYEEKYAKNIEKFAYLDDGNASRRVLDVIFHGKGEEYCRYSRSEKPRILVQAGAIQVARTRELLVQILRELNSAQNDVFVCGSGLFEKIDELDRMAPNVQIMCTKLEKTMTFGEWVIRKLQAFFGKRTYHDREILLREARREFGDLTFDTIINLSVRGSAWHNILSAIPCRKKYLAGTYSENCAEDIAKVAADYEEIYIVDGERDAERLSAIPNVHYDIKGAALFANPISRMKVGFLTGFDSTNYAYVNVIRELKARGHEAVVIVQDVTDTINLKMFSEAGIGVIAYNKITHEEFSSFDFVVTGPIRFRKYEKLYKYMESNSIITVSFATLLSSVAMRVYPDIALCLGENKFREFKDNQIKYNFIAIGNPQYDDLVGAPTRPEVRKVLFLDQGAYPFGTEGKRELGRTISAIAKNNPQCEIIVKPRYIPDESGRQLHKLSEHIYDFIEEIPDNLTLLREPTILEELMKEVDAVVTLWSTAYLDAVMMDLPIVLLEGFPSQDVFDVRLKRVADAYNEIRTTGCLIDYHEVLDKPLVFKKADIEAMGREIYHYKEKSAPKVVDVFEKLYRENILLQMGILRMEPMTYRKFMDGSGKVELCDRNDLAFRRRVIFLRKFNDLMQDYVYLNRCMADAVDLGPMYRFWDMEFDADEKNVNAVRDALNEAKALHDELLAKFFTENEERAAKDPILSDYYVEWLLNGENDAKLLEALDKHPKINPISTAYGRAVAAYHRADYEKAADFFEDYRRQIENVPVQYLHKSRSFNSSRITTEFGEDKFLEVLLEKDYIELMEILYSRNRFAAAVRTYCWMEINRRHGNYRAMLDAYEKLMPDAKRLKAGEYKVPKKGNARYHKKQYKLCNELYQQAVAKLMESGDMNEFGVLKETLEAYQ